MEEKKEPKPLNLEQMFKEEFITKAEDVFGALDGLSADWTGNYQEVPG